MLLFQLVFAVHIPLPNLGLLLMAIFRFLRRLVLERHFREWLAGLVS